MERHLGMLGLARLIAHIRSGLAQAGRTAQADQVTFSDGETFQQKYDSGALAGAAGEPGPAGPQGPQGPAGAAAGFGAVTASIGGGVGTPSVSVVAAGPNSARRFSFAFENLKGEPGRDGLDGKPGRDGVDGTVGHADYITEQGVEDGWYYRIWHSGRREGWKRFTYAKLTKTELAFTVETSAGTRGVSTVVIDPERVPDKLEGRGSFPYYFASLYTENQVEVSSFKVDRAGIPGLTPELRCRVYGGGTATGLENVQLDWYVFTPSA